MQTIRSQSALGLFLGVTSITPDGQVIGLWCQSSVEMQSAKNQRKRKKKKEHGGGTVTQRC